MKQETYYIKVGKKYQPVSYYDSNMTDAMPEGAHLVIVKPGSVSKLFNIDPAFVTMVAAGRYAEAEMSEAIHMASEAMPDKGPVTQEQKDAWDNCKKVFNNDHFSITSPSAHYVAQAGINALQKEIDNMMLTNPTVRLAYEEFLLIWRLAKCH